LRELASQFVVVLVVVLISVHGGLVLFVDIV
jgi:hypothetical protein